MPDERGLIGRAGHKPPAHALFFAAVPSADMRAQMAAVWRRLGTAEPMRYNTLHLSILGIAQADRLDPALVERACQAVRSLRQAPFTLDFDRLRTYPNRSRGKPLVLATGRASPELSAVAAELRAACRAMGLTGTGSATVTPHVTLAYGPGWAEDRRLDQPIRW